MSDLTTASRRKALVLAIVIPAALGVAFSGELGVVLIMLAVAVVGVAVGWKGVPRFWSRIGRGVAAGALVGALVMGPGLRLAMRVVAVLEPTQSPEFTVEGTMFIVVLGLFLGAIFGMGLALAGGGDNGVVASFIVALGGLGLLVATPDIRTELLELGWGWPLNVPMFGVVFYLYSRATVRLLGRWADATRPEVVDLDKRGREASWTGGSSN